MPRGIYDRKKGSGAPARAKRTPAPRPNAAALEQLHIPASSALSASIDDAGDALVQVGDAAPAVFSRRQMDQLTSWWQRVRGAAGDGSEA